MRLTMIALASLLTLFPPSAAAYIGPGLGLGAVGLILALLVSVILALVGLFWYPLKRRLSRRSEADKADSGADSKSDSA